jgi:hypothetical protein
MTKTQCPYCSFFGHGYEQASHYATAHVGNIKAEIVSIDEQNKTATIKFADDKQITVPFNPPKGELVQVTMYLRWSKK